MNDRHSSSRSKSHFAASVALLVVSFGSPLAALAQEELETTDGYPERVIQWMVEDGETCADIADALYGDAKHQSLVARYNPVKCPGVLTAGRILVVPYAVADVPAARLHGSSPTVRARVPDSEWQVARTGMALDDGYGVNTMSGASADILFRDRSRIYLQQNTLVIIYGTAETSRKSSSERMRITLDEGELRAGIAALSGRPIELDTAGGGQVVAESDDTVLRRKSQRTTVSVFDGHATVKNAGASVRVEKNFGSAFVKAKPPTPPRPLPPAPSWVSGNGPDIQLRSAQQALELGWSEVDGVVAYRVEIALDDEFNRVVLRQQVPADVYNLRAENLPPSTYHVRVRGVDAEDFLGISSEVATTSIVHAEFELGRFQGDGILLSPYASLALDNDTGVEASLDGTTFSTLPHRFELEGKRPKTLKLRRKGGAASSDIALSFEQPQLELSAERVEQELAVSVHAKGLGPLAQRAGYRFWIEQRGSGRWLDGQLTDDTLAVTTSVDHEHTTRVHLADAQGAVVARLDVPPKPPLPVSELAARTPRIGPRFAVTSSNRELSFDWWRVGAPAAVAAGGVSAGSVDGSQLSGTGTARWRDFGADLRITTNSLDRSTPTDGSLFAHARYGTWLGESTRWDLRLGTVLPAASVSPPPRASFGAGIGGLFGNWTWLVNTDVRAAVSSDTDGLSSWQMRGGYGMTYSLIELVRAFALLDAYWVGDRARAAGQFGIEMGDDFAGTLGVRVSPFGDDNATWTFGAGLSLTGD